MQNYEKYYRLKSLDSDVWGPPSLQRQKNLGSRVALLPGKFLRLRKVFARITDKNC